jgi:glycerol uptake facilitator-like aquaporin
MNPRVFTSEFLGSAFLLAVVVGSGIMGERLAGGNVAIALLANSAATGFALVALIQAFGPVSGAHFNPVVSMVAWLEGRLSRSEVAGYVLAQFLGAFVGVIVAHLMFGESWAQVSAHDRSTLRLVGSEFVATFGLVFVILSVSRASAASIPVSVGSYVAAAYWFTSSTAFANPAVTLARVFTNTFAGGSPSGLPGFWAAQVLAGLAAWKVFRLLTAVPREGPAS